MICVNCGTPLPNEAVCCFKCAYPTAAKFDTGGESARRVETFEDEQTVLRGEPIQKTVNQNKGYPVVAGVIAALAVMAAVTLVVIAIVENRTIYDANANYRSPIQNSSIPAKLPLPMPETQKSTTRVVGRFIRSGMFVVREEVRALNVTKDGDFMYKKKTSKLGWYVDDLPCNTSLQITFGYTLNFGRTFFVPCQNEPLGIGLYDWNTGEFIGDDMDNI